MSDQQLTVREQAASLLLDIGDQLGGALPKTVDPKRFEAVFLTAIAKNRDIMQCTSNSLTTALLAAAADGLVPDGREAAFIPYNTKVKGRDGKERYVKVCQYMPMIAGIIKRARELGDVFSITSSCVYANDVFEVDETDVSRTSHRRPQPMGADRGQIVGVYAIFRDKRGQVIHREIMTKAEIERTRAVSRNRSGGVWNNWFEEMARKTVIRRGAKYLPMSDQLRAIVERDDEHVDLETAALPPAPHILAQRLAHAKPSDEGFDEARFADADVVDVDELEEDRSGDGGHSPDDDGAEGADPAGDQARAADDAPSAPPIFASDDKTPLNTLNEKLFECETRDDLNVVLKAFEGAFDDADLMKVGRKIFATHNQRVAGKLEAAAAFDEGAALAGGGN